MSGSTLFINCFLRIRYQCWVGEGIRSKYPRNHPSSTLSIGNSPILKSTLPFRDSVWVVTTQSPPLGSHILHLSRSALCFQGVGCWWATRVPRQCFGALNWLEQRYNELGKSNLSHRLSSLASEVPRPRQYLRALQRRLWLVSPLDSS